VVCTRFDYTNATWGYQKDVTPGVVSKFVFSAKGKIEIAP
jgi:hypothetical protein